MPAQSLQRRGERIADRYVLGDVLGTGGMGVVYAAVKRGDDDAVVVKLPRPELANDPYVRCRFRDEAVAGARIDHRNVVQILESGHSRGTPYLVMEHVTGCSLARLAAELCTMAIAQAVGLVLEVLAGLDAMHAAGVVHGDVKSDNVLVATQRDGTAALKLIDLGLARFVDGSGAAGWEGVVSGTPEYLAPEVIAGEPPTFASDQYAVGVILYELIAGDVPFAGHSPSEIAERQLVDRAASLAVHRPDLACTAALDEILERVLAKDPRDRYPHLGALARALGHVADTAPVRLIATDATTGVWRVEPWHRLARPQASDAAQAAAHRRTLAAALATGRVAAIVDAYLTLVGALVDEHRLASAIEVLESGIAMLGAHAEVAYVRGVWRLELSLAALHDGHGDREAARRLAQAAHAHASSCGSSIGVDRAARLLARLVRCDRPTARARPGAR